MTFFSSRSRQKKAGCPSCKSTASKNWKDMDFAQKFTEGDEFIYAADDSFVDGIGQLGRVDSLRIMNLISENNGKLKSDRHEPLVGVLPPNSKREALFFRFEFYSESDFVVLSDFAVVDSDEYLDSLIEGNNLNYGERDGGPEQGHH